MNIADFLTEDNITLDLKALSKEEAIRRVAESLRNSESISDFELFLKGVFERESVKTTGIGNHVAIPHARTDAVVEFTIAFARVPAGIEFDSVDGKPVKFIFLMGTPKEKGLSSYLTTLAHLTRLVSKQSFQETLLKAKEPGEVIEEFRRFEQ